MRREGEKLKSQQQWQSAPLSRELHCQNPSFSTVSLPLVPLFCPSGTKPLLSFTYYPKEEENTPAVPKKKRVEHFQQESAAVMPVWVQSAPRQESDCSCKHLCQSAFVSMSHSLSHRWRHLSARALPRLSEYSQINQCRKSPHKFQWKMKHQSTLSTIHSAWRQLFTVMGIVHHIWDWEAILIITQPLMEGQIPYPATMHTSSCLQKTESLWWIRSNFKGGKAPTNTSLVIIILPGYLSWAYNNKKNYVCNHVDQKTFLGLLKELI